MEDIVKMTRSDVKHIPEEVENTTSSENRILWLPGRISPPVTPGFGIHPEDTRTDTGMYLQTGDHGSRIKHPILQQHLVSGRQKILYQKRYLHGNPHCVRSGSTGTTKISENVQ